MTVWGKAIIPLLSYGLMIGILLLNLILPFCYLNQTQENVLVILSMGGMFMLCFPLLILSRATRAYLRKHRAVSFFVILMLILTPAYFSIMTRAHDVVRVHWQFEGEVERKYRQGSHQAAAIELAGQTYTFVPEALWQQLKVGDVLQKTECGNRLLLNGQPVLFD